MYVLGFLRKLGRCFQLTIAILPVAAVLLRLGSPELLNLPSLAVTGEAIFDNLPLLFALGVACLWSKNQAGEAALAGGAGFLVMTSLIKKLDSTINMGILGGVIPGIIAGEIFNRFHNVKLYDFLAFFSGKRLIPIMSALIIVPVGYICGFIWPVIGYWLNIISKSLLDMRQYGSFLFGFLNRLLLPTGLHQIINNYLWYQVGQYTNDVGEISEGDMTRFYSGDRTAGIFMAGFYPIMLAGLPAACLAMYNCIDKEYRNKFKGIFLSLAMTSFFTGITEPLEFSFVFVAPSLYLIHAFLTGMSLYLATLLNIHAGFSFSASFIDLLLMYNMPSASNVVIFLPLCILFAVLYYFIFYFAIKIYDIKTTGREIDLEQKNKDSEKMSLQKNNNESEVNNLNKCYEYIEALGGKENIVEINSCITRLRLIVNNKDKINKDKIIALGARGIVEIDDKHLQIIIGTQAENLCSEIREFIN